MLVKGLKAPEGLTINFAPSPRQYEMWKLLQPNYCPHCGGEIELIVVSHDEKGLPVHAPQCKKCHSRKLPQIILGGGAGGGGKSFVGSAWIVSSCLRFPDSRAVVARKTLKALKGSTFNTIKLILRLWGLVQDENYKINNLDGIVTFYNVSTISLIELEDLPSDPEFERLGSNEWSFGFVDECSQVSEKAVEVLFSRLRWNTAETFIYPRLLLTTNPCMNWVRTRFVQDENGDPAVLAPHDAYVPFTVFDNPNKAFVATYRASLDKISDKVTRERILYGNWDFIETNEAAAYWNFDGNLHLIDNLKEKIYNPLKPIVLSWDFNVAPYMSCLALQIDYEGKNIYVLEEILGRAEDKENNTPKLADKISKKYQAEKHIGGILVTGDPAGLSRSTQTEDGVNNYTIISKHLHKSLRARRQLLTKQPAQVTRLEFINSLFHNYDGWNICIDMRCRRLAEDLIYQKKLPTGEKEKKKYTDPKLGIKCERYGHLSDCLDYAICLLLAKSYSKFQRGTADAQPITTYTGTVYGNFDY